MSNDRFYADIKSLLEKNGAMGVNQLAKALDAPLSTIQKYLDKDQTYFKKNHARKWILPEISVNDDMSAVSANYSNIIDSQLLSMNALIDTLMSQFRATISLIDANKGSPPPVAGKSPVIHASITTMYNEIDLLTSALKKKMSEIPEEYRDLLKNTDWVPLTLDCGRTRVTKNINPEIVELILGNSDTLSDMVLKTLEEYQK